MKDREHFRDEALGAALRELEVPEHRPRFEHELEELLARPRRWPSRIPAWRAGVLVAAGAAVTAVVILLVGLPGSSGPSTALAARVKARVAAAFAGAETVSGTIVYRELDPRTKMIQTARASFAMSGRGDLRVRTLRLDEDAAYNAGQGVERGYGRSASLGGGKVFAYERTGVAPGPPDGGPSDRFLQRRLGSAVRALMISGKPPVTNAVEGGRHVWRVELPVRPNTISPDFDRLAITIDRETGFPTRVAASLHGAFRSELRVEGLRVDSKLPPDEFSLRFPPGTEVNRSNDGFRRLRFDDLAAQVGYMALVPDAVPAGYKLSETAVARLSTPPASVSNPPSRDVVALSYRRGFDQLVVTTRLRGGPTVHWRDPLSAGGGIDEPSRSVRLHEGALAGHRATVVVGLRSVPHLWVVTDTLVVTVSGDLTEFELIQLAESLHSSSSVRAGACGAGDVRASVGLQGATGSLAGELGLTNVADAPCTVTGRPSVRIVRADGRPLPVRQVAAPLEAGRPAQAAPVLVVESRGRVVARLAWRNWCGGPTGPLKLSIGFAHSRGRVTAPLGAGTPRCDAPGAPSILRVQPFTSGSM